LIRVAVLAPALALCIGMREVLAEAALPQGLPPADVWVLTSADFIEELDEEQSPPLLLLTDDQEEAARLSGLPVWGVLPLDASAE
jgi:hypothetical protein